MKPYILRQAWFVQNFKKRLGTIANFLLQNGFLPETVQKALHPAWIAIKNYESKGETINETDVMKKITQGIAQYGKDQGVDFSKFKHIPYIDSKYLGALLVGLDKPADIGEEPIKKMQRPRKQTIKMIQQEIEARKKLDEQAEKDVVNIDQAKKIRDIEEQLFREQASLDEQINKFLHRKSG